MLFFPFFLVVGGIVGIDPECWIMFFWVRGIVSVGPLYLILDFDFCVYILARECILKQSKAHARIERFCCGPLPTHPFIGGSLGSRKVCNNQEGFTIWIPSRRIPPADPPKRCNLVTPGSPPSSWRYPSPQGLDGNDTTGKTPFTSVQVEKAQAGTAPPFFSHRIHVW